MSEVIALFSLGVAVIAVVRSWKATSAADRANSIGNRANDLALDANRSATEASRAAMEANQIAERAVVEAQRSADAAEVSFALQKEEALAASQVRQEALLAEVRAIRWETSGSAARTDRGIHFQNYGPATASQFWGVFTNGNKFLRVERPAIAAGETAVLQRWDEGWTPAQGDEPPPYRDDREVAARAFWLNADGTSGDSGWHIAARH